MVVRVLGELRALLTDAESSTPGEEHLLVARLFPAVYDDPQQESEYQRLMRDELVASRIEAIDAVTEVLHPRKMAPLDEREMLALMQSTNAVRLVLGTMLGIADDESAEAAEGQDSAEHSLYHFLGWLLEWTVRSMS